jgi:hypothetical protein
MREDDWLNRPWRPACPARGTRSVPSGGRRVGALAAEPPLDRCRSSSAAPPITSRTAVTPSRIGVGRSAERARGRGGSSEAADALEWHVELERGPAAGAQRGAASRTSLPPGAMRRAPLAPCVAHPRMMASCASRTMRRALSHDGAMRLSYHGGVRLSHDGVAHPRMMAPRAARTCASRRIGGVAARRVERRAIFCYRSGARPGPSDSRLRL